MHEWKGHNRRKFPRIIYPCLVKFFSEMEGQEVFLTHTENISAGGCYVILKKAARPKSTVAIELDLLDSHDHLVLEGVVMWESKRKMDERHKPMFHDVGIEFQHVNATHKKRLETAITHLIRKGFRPLKAVY